jgi:hypothetical protein
MMTTVVMVMVMVMQMMLLLQHLLMLMLPMLKTDARVRRVPGTDDLGLWPMRQNVQDTERLDASIIGLAFPLVLVLRVLHHLHHLETLERLEVVVRRFESGGDRLAALGPHVHVVVVVVVVVVLVVLVVLVVVDGRDGIAAVANRLAATATAVRHPVIAISRGRVVLVVRERVPLIGSSGTQTIGIVIPGGGQLVLRVGGHDDQR